MPRPSFYCCKSKIENPRVDSEERDIADTIQTIYLTHYESYGYRRVTMELRNRGCQVNHKKVYRIMRERGLRVTVRHCRKYSSYRGRVGTVAPNYLNRDFEASRPGEKVVGDVTEFHIGEEKLYLSTFEDLYSGFVLGYSISRSPTLNFVMDSIEMAVKSLERKIGMVHTDQGWQYQNARYVNFLKDNGILQSMSRKGNCHDNSLAENLFSQIKKEVFYPQFKEIESIEDLRGRIEEYIRYYNEERIQERLMGMTPAAYQAMWPRLCPAVIQ